MRDAAEFQLNLALGLARPAVLVFGRRSRPFALVSPAAIADWLACPALYPPKFKAYFVVYHLQNVT